MSGCRTSRPSLARAASLATFCVLVLVAGQRLRAQTIAPGAGDTSSSSSTPLPEAPSVVFVNLTSAEDARGGITMLRPCSAATPAAQSDALGPPLSPAASAQPAPCIDQKPIRVVVDSDQRQPLTVRQKAYLAAHSVFQPSNFAVLVIEAGIGVGSNAHSAYGPGLKGVGRLTGYEFAQDAQYEFLGTFLIPSLTHEDPRYRRMQTATIKRRIFHALSRTVLAEHDDGTPMLNYATLLSYPISAELSNLYVPGVQGNGPSTARRIAISFATDPASNLIAEFLPDIARRIHIRSIFVQQIVNQMALGQGLGQ